MRLPFHRRNGHSFDTDAALTRQPRWLSSQWVGKLSSSYHQATNWVTQGITRRIRNWESQTSISRRRRQVLLLFGAIGLAWVIRLIYLLTQPPLPSSLLPRVGEITKVTKLGLSQSQREMAADSTHKADYLNARRGFVRGLEQTRQLNTN